MRKPLLIGLITAAAIALIVTIVLYRFMERDTGAPKRPRGVPAEATWRGAADEGFWLLLAGVDSTSRQYRFRIYADYDGHLTLDANFKPSDSGMTDLPLDTGIFKRIRYYELDKIHLDTGRLDMVYPAFGGSFWEVEKNINKQKKANPGN
jgi:hypothetical protein